MTAESVNSNLSIEISMTEVDERERRLRRGLSSANIVVVKVGSRVLVRKDGRPDKRRLGKLAKGLSFLMAEGKSVILVSSGAIGAGLKSLGMKQRPKQLFKLQMAAAVGQTRLVGMYHDEFAKFGIEVGQVLLTHDVLKHKVKHVNARNCLLNLCKAGIVPIVNENDAVVLDEIVSGEESFGDNDKLASLVAKLVEADSLVIISTVDGLRKREKNGRRKRVRYIEKITPSILNLVEPSSKNSISKGGMRSKLEAASIAVKAGVVTAIIDGGKPDEAVKGLFAGKSIGTIFGKAK